MCRELLKMTRQNCQKTGMSYASRKTPLRSPSCIIHASSMHHYCRMSSMDFVEQITIAATFDGLVPCRFRFYKHNCKRYYAQPRWIRMSNVLHDRMVLCAQFLHPSCPLMLCDADSCTTLAFQQDPMILFITIF